MSFLSNTLRFIGNIPELDRLARMTTMSDQELSRRGKSRADLHREMMEIVGGH